MADRARVAVLISGRGSNMAALLYAAKAGDCPYEVVVVGSNDPDAPGLELAAAEGIATFAHSHVGMKRESFDAMIDEELRDAGAQFVALAGYMRILSDEFVGKWDGRMLNIHPSLLPKYKGLDVQQRAIDAGDKISGCSVHLVTPELDDGPVLGQTRVTLLENDTAESLAARILFAEHQLYPRTLAAYVNRERDPAWLLDRIRALVEALPETEEKSSHGNPGFRIAGGKFFAHFSDNHHRNGIIALLVKTSGSDEQAALIEAEPDLYYKPSYYGPSGWIGIRLDQGDTDWAHIESWLRKSWSLIAPKKLQALAEFLN